MMDERGNVTHQDTGKGFLLPLSTLKICNLATVDTLIGLIGPLFEKLSQALIFAMPFLLDAQN